MNSAFFRIRRKTVYFDIIMRANVRLCKHEKHYEDPPRSCKFAHRLYELSLMPRRAHSDGKQGDRWVGQKLTAAQKSTFRWYYHKSKSWELPTWAKGLMWYINDADPQNFPDCPWDFDLIGDSRLYNDSAVFYEDLWAKLYEREKKLRPGIF